MLDYLSGEKCKFTLGFLWVCAFIFFGYLPILAAAPADVSVVDLEKGAKKEGKLVFYTSFSMAEAAVVVDNFQKKYPFLKVDLYRLSNEQILTRVVAEHRANRYTVDVINLKGDGINFFKKNGLLSAYASPERKFYADGFKDKEGYWTDIFTSVYSVVYNTRMIAPHEVPVTYQDLLKPRWKGKMGFNTNNHMWAEAVMQIMGKEEGMKYLEALARQNPVARAGGTITVMLTVAGEYALAVPVNDSQAEPVRIKGAPIDWVGLKPYYGDLHPISMAANAPHPYAGQLFIDYVLSQEGQSLVMKLGKTPSRKGLKSKVRAEEINAIDPAIDGEYYKKLVKQIFR
jgi:iron(III) transport system substrate-binding protein